MTQHQALSVFISLAVFALLLLGVRTPTEQSPRALPAAEVPLAEQAQRVRAGQSDQLRLDRTLVRDVDLAHLDGLEDSLRRINFSRSQITDAGMAQIGRMRQLVQLRLASPRVTDNGLEPIGHLQNLRFVHLIGMPITDEGLRHFHALKQLESLYLDDTRVSDEGLAELLKAVPHVHLHIDDAHHPLDPHAGEHRHD